MQLTLAYIGSSRASGASAAPKSQYESLIRLYLDRIQAYQPCQSQAFAAESAFLAWLTRPNPASKTISVLLHGGGRQLSSTEFAAWLANRRDTGAQHIALAIGPADGWSPTALEYVQAHQGLLLSFGPITMAHDLARLVLAEQLYRACTIWAGHPYHSGH